MNRNDILRAMEALALPPDEYWIQAGAALVLHGVRPETHDVDIGCTHALIERLRAAGCPFEDMPDGHRKYAVTPEVEASEDWAGGTVTRIDGLPVVSLEDVAALKRALGREKDLRDLERIRAFLKQ